MQKPRFHMLLNGFTYTHTFLEGFIKPQLLGPFVENSSRQPVRRILSRTVLKLYLKRARAHEEAKGCHRDLKR